MITILEIEGKLSELRQKYKSATASNREIIKRQARALEIARERIEKKNAAKK